jgi:hypothetical protein
MPIFHEIHRAHLARIGSIDSPSRRLHSQRWRSQHVQMRSDACPLQRQSGQTIGEMASGDGLQNWARLMELWLGTPQDWAFCTGGFPVNGPFGGALLGAFPNGPPEVS